MGMIKAVKEIGITVAITASMVASLFCVHMFFASRAEARPHTVWGPSVCKGFEIAGGVTANSIRIQGVVLMNGPAKLSSGDAADTVLWAVANKCPWYDEQLAAVIADADNEQSKTTLA